jgi:hypothetical protein
MEHLWGAVLRATVNRLNGKWNGWQGRSANASVSASFVVAV